MPVIDNFSEIRNHLRFDNPGDMYVVHILARQKDMRDNPQRAKALKESHNSGSLIKTFYIDSFEYFDRKIAAIKDISTRNEARAYLVMSRRNRLTCNRMLAKKIIDEIDNPNIHYDHLIRSAVCGCHVSDYKWWMIDVDLDLVPNSITDTREGKLKHARTAFVQNVLKEITPLVAETKRSSDEVFVVPTLNGTHVVTPPFNRSKWYGLYGELKTDPMTLLYFNPPDVKE